MHSNTAWKIGVAVLWLSVLSWLPWEVKILSPWCGPVACLGQMAGETGPNPENIVGAFPGNSFTSSINIVGNTMTEVNGISVSEISNSFRGFTGIAQVNQAAGYMNNQINLVGIASGKATQAIQSGQTQVKNNVLSTSNNTYQTAITGASFAGGTGVAMVSQTSGNMNAQFNAFNLAMGSKPSLTDAQLSAVGANNAINNDPAAPNKYSNKLDLEGGAFKNFTGFVSTSQVAGNMNQVSTVFNVNVIAVP